VPVANVKSLSVASTAFTVLEKVIALDVVVNVGLVLNVTAPVYVCVPLVVTFAPKSAVVETESEVADVIAALRSSAPVIAIAPSVRLPPTTPLNSTSDEPTLRVKLLVSEASEFTVPLKVTCALVVVKVVPLPKVMVSEAALSP